MVIWRDGAAYTLTFDPERFRGQRISRGFSLNDRRWWHNTPAKAVTKWQRPGSKVTDATLIRIASTLGCTIDDLCVISSCAIQVDGATDGFDRNTFDHTVTDGMKEILPVSSATLWPHRDRIAQE